MPAQSFVKQLRQRTGLLWRSILDHPFVKGIGDGTLSRDRFEFYLKQDYIYLIDFSRLLALAVAKARALPEMQRLAEVLRATLTDEMQLHRRTCADFGITAENLERTTPALITAAYTDFLLRTAYDGPIEDILAALLPCALGYVEIADRLQAAGLPDHRHYRDWIEHYSAAEMKDIARWLEMRMDQVAERASDDDRERWFGLYQRSARYELLFFEMSWQKALDPVGFALEGD